MCEPGDYKIGFLHVMTELQLFLWANLSVANLHVCAQHRATLPQCVSVEGVISTICHKQAMSQCCYGL